MTEKKNQTVVTAEPGAQEVFITREIDAPRALVFKAHTDPDLYVQWLGPRGYEMILETFEPVSGGKYRYIQGVVTFCVELKGLAGGEKVL